MKYQKLFEFIKNSTLHYISVNILINLRNRIGYQNYKSCKIQKISINEKYTGNLYRIVYTKFILYGYIYYKINDCKYKVPLYIRSFQDEQNYDFTILSYKMQLYKDIITGDLQPEDQILNLPPLPYSDEQIIKYIELLDI